MYVYLILYLRVAQRSSLASNHIPKLQFPLAHSMAQYRRQSCHMIGLSLQHGLLVPLPSNIYGRFPPSHGMKNMLKDQDSHGIWPCALWLYGQSSPCGSSSSPSSTLLPSSAAWSGRKDSLVPPSKSSNNGSGSSPPAPCWYLPVQSQAIAMALLSPADVWLQQQWRSSTPKVSSINNRNALK